MRGCRSPGRPASGIRSAGCSSSALVAGGGLWWWRGSRAEATTGATGSPSHRPRRARARAEPEPDAGADAPRGPRRDVSDGARFVRPSLDADSRRATRSPPLAAGVASLGLNEGLSGPFPSALAAIEATARRLNRYPARGSYELTPPSPRATASRRSRSSPAAGADALIGYVCQAVLEPGDEVVVPWPSFPSFVRDPQKRDAVPVIVPLVDGPSTSPRSRRR